MLKPVPSRRDPDRCAACAHRATDAPQCPAEPTTMRAGYPVCRRHAKARFFALWTGMTMLEACRAYQRVISQLRDPPPPLKQVTEAGSAVMTISDDERDDNVDDPMDDPTDAEVEAAWRRELAVLFRECRNTLKLSQSELAQILDQAGGGRTIGKWERGTQQIPGTAWLALIAMMMADDQIELTQKLFNAESGPVSNSALAFFAVRLGSDPPYGYKLVSDNGDGLEV